MNTKDSSFSSILTVNLFFLLISIGIMLTAFSHMPSIENFGSGLYLFCAIFGFTSIIWFLISLACYGSLKLTKSILPSVAIITFSLFVLYLDIRVYSLYRSHLNVGILEYIFTEAFAELARVGASAGITMLFGALFLAVFVYGSVKFLFKNFIPIVDLKITRIIYWSLFLCFLGSQITYMYVDVTNYIPIKKWTRHIPFYQPLTARRAMIKHGIVDSSKIRSYEVRSDFSDASINYSKDLKCEEDTVKPNILWLFIDSWRFDDFNKEVTPNIYNWANKTTLDTFENHWSIGNETIPSLFSIFYSVPGLYIKPFTESGTTPNIISKFIKEDYDLNILTSWPIDATTLSKNIFRDVKSLETRNLSENAYESDFIIKNNLLKFLKERNKEKPFYSFMIFDSAHDYSLPPDYKAPFKPFSQKLDYMKLTASTDPTLHKNRGRNAVHYIDSLIGEILKSPDLKDSDRPTIIMVTSDHGEQFNDFKKNYWGHSSNFSRYQLRVPLMIKWDGVKTKHPSTESIDLNSNKTYKHMTTHNDMSHTFLETVFNCDLEPNQSVGDSLYSKTARFPLLLSTYSRHGVLTKDKIYSYEVGLGYEVYDYDYNEVTDHDVPKEIFKQYLDASTQFYQ